MFELLDAALAEWRRSRSATLSEAVQLLGAEIDAQRVREPAGKTMAERLARWSELAAQRRAADVGELMRTFLDVPGFALHGRLAHLRSCDPDPRIALSMITAIEQTFAPRGATWNHYKELSAILVRHGDARVLARIREKVPAGFKNAALSRTTLWGKTALELARALTVHAVDDPAREDQLLARARAHRVVEPPQRDRAELLAAIHDDPRDDGARHVYADYLLLRSDPLGELINLQLARASVKRQQELLMMYADEWLGPLAPLVMKDGRVFERGFLHAARLATKPADVVARAFNAPEWSTIAELDLQSWTGTPQILAQSTLRALRVLRGVNPAWMATVELPASVDHVAFHRGEWFARNGLAAVAALSPACSWRVAQLELPACRLGSGLDAFWRSELVRNLDTLTVELQQQPWEPQAALGAQLAQLFACPVRRVCVRTAAREASWLVELVREPTGHRRIRIAARGRVAPVASLADLLFAIETDEVSHVEMANVTPDIVASLAEQTGWRCELV